MCIRDRPGPDRQRFEVAAFVQQLPETLAVFRLYFDELGQACLLYTSDAADQRSSVDLGGRRIIKKKKHIMHSMQCQTTKHRPMKYLC